MVPVNQVVLGSRAFSWTPWRTETPVSVAQTTPVDHIAPSEASTSTATLPSSSTGAAPITSPSSATGTGAEHESILSSLTAHSTNAGPSISDALSSLPPASITDPSLLPQSPASGSIPSLEELILHSGKSLSEVLHSPEAVHAAVKTADLKLIGLQHGVFNLSGWVQEALVGMHSVTGLPWYVGSLRLVVRLRKGRKCEGELQGVDVVEEGRRRWMGPQGDSS